MKSGSTTHDNALVSFQRFERAVRHIVSVPKQKVLELEKKNGHRAKNHSKRNGRR